MEQPVPFLEILVHDLDDCRGCSGLSVGYESGQWRYEDLANHVMEWLPEFALSAKECENLRHSNAIGFIRRAAQAVYTSEKFQNRGEFGELFLHIAIRQAFQSLPAISKIYFKDSSNETVKGFDAVHVVGNPESLELWLGEAKFYGNISNAIRDVAAEINRHTETDYLRSEFVFISNKLDERRAHADALKKLLDPNTSLDEVFARACIPVLLTYDSETVAKHSEVGEDYNADFKEEIGKHHKTFCNANLPKEIRIHLFLLPLKKKADLVTELDKKLRTWQDL